MLRIAACICVAATLLISAGCHQPVETPQAKAANERQERLGKSWPVPEPAANEGERFWTLQNGYLSLWEPDDKAPPPIPGRDLLSLHCKSRNALSVEPDMIIQQDVPLSFPPFDTLSLEAGSIRLHTEIRRVSNGYTTWAAGDFTTKKVTLGQILSAPFFVIRPLYLGDNHEAYSSEDIGERYSSPPAALAEAFLSDCRMS